VEGRTNESIKRDVTTASATCAAIGFLDRGLLSICPPVIINRCPHTLKEFYTWNANELRSWLFHWQPSVLCGVLPTEFLVHYSLLVIGCRLLCQSQISSEQIEEARKLLLKFYQIYEVLYGTKAVTMKMHLLQHLPDVVEKWGGLWGHSCF
jgi:hypothetical protein